MTFKKLITELFKVAVETSHFVIALKIADSSSYVLEEFLHETVQILIDALGSYPHFAEVKLLMLGKMVPCMDFD